LLPPSWSLLLLALRNTRQWQGVFASTYELISGVNPWVESKAAPGDVGTSGPGKLTIS